MVHHVLLTCLEMPGAACFWVLLGERGWVPLLETAFGFWTIEAEEEDVFVCHFGRQVLRVLEF